jgi:hypothetical protein
MMVSKEITLTEIAALTQSGVLFKSEARSILRTHGIIEQREISCAVCRYWLDKKIDSVGRWGKCARLSTLKAVQVATDASEKFNSHAMIYTHEQFGCNQGKFVDEGGALDVEICLTESDSGEAQE